MSPGVCESVGEAKPDIGGIGILLAFGGQTVISLVLSFWLIYISNAGKISVDDKEEKEISAVEKKRFELLSEILIMGNDAQLVTGVALVITGLAGATTLDLYHLHLMFDTASLVGISNTATMTCWSVVAARTLQYRSRSKPGRISRATRRLSGTYLFSALYLALAILLCVRLKEWNYGAPGKCYHTHLFMSPHARHPRDDQIYVAFTAAWLLFSTIGPSYGKLKHANGALTLGLTQFPLHVYVLVTLRSANQDFLEGDHAENDWEFGQTVAVVLLGQTLSEIIQALYTYRKFNKEVRRGINVHALENGD